MRPTAGFWMALRALRANKIRSALTLLGMVIGVFAIISSVTAVKVIDVYFEESLRFMGTGTFSVQRYGVGERRDETRSRKSISYAQVQRLEERISSGLRVSYLERYGWVTQAKHNEHETEPNLEVYGTNDHFLQNFGYELAEGRPITEQDMQYARPVVLLGAPIADQLFPNESPLGKEVRVQGLRLEVIGVLEKKGSFLGYRPDDRLLIPFSYLLSLSGGEGLDIDDVNVRAPTIHQVPSAMDEVIGHMRVIREVPPGEENNFSLETNDSMRSAFDTFTAALAVGGAGIGLIALLAAGVGIMNIMLVSVTERTREVGVRKAVGARRRDILLQFLFEALVLCLIGGLLGVLSGGLFGNLLALFFDIQAAFPVAWGLSAVVMVVAIALVFGAYPAYKAARLDPIQSLRYE